MRRSKFSDARIAFLLRQDDEGTAIARSVARPGSAHNWREKYGGVLQSEVRQLRQLEEEAGKSAMADHVCG
jgi:CTP-dependent riboflavin kinase